jgi:hypothetical protein
MAGVRKINDFPLRYLVTHTHRLRLDDCEMSVVEQMLPHPDRPYWLCMKHQDTCCACVAAVITERERIGLGDKEPS